MWSSAHGGDQKRKGRQDDLIRGLHVMEKWRVGNGEIVRGEGFHDRETAKGQGQ